MLTRNCLGITSLVSFGLMVGCSDDSSTTPKDDIADITETITNACTYDGYTAMQGASGETLCLDPEGTLAFWINADGSYGFPEASQESGSTEQPDNTGNSSNDSSTTPTNESSTEDSTGSASKTNTCTTEKALYTINGISYYKNEDGTLYYFDADCNKASLTESTPASSSSISESSISSESTKPVSSSSIVTPNSSATTISNGNVPTISYTASGASVENNNSCVTVTGGEVVITCAGDYDFSGSYSGADAQIRVYSPKSDSGVYLNLRGLTLTNTADAPIYSQMSSKTFVVAKSGTTNTLSDGSTRTKSYTYVNSNNETKVDTTSACIYAKDDLTIKGEGTLIVKGNYNNGIHTSNDLRFRGATTINVTAANNGLKGKGIVDIENGNITIAATNGDGIKSDEGEDAGSIVDNKGIVNIKGGNITITKAGDDGIQAYNYIIVQDSVSEPTIKVTSTGKGIVSDNRVYINAGKIDISSGDDGVHSNQNVYFNGGYTTIAAPKNDGVHADSTLMINDGTIYVTNSYEGLRNR